MATIVFFIVYATSISSYILLFFTHASNAASYVANPRYYYSHASITNKNSIFMRRSLCTDLLNIDLVLPRSLETDLKEIVYTMPIEHQPLDNHSIDISQFDTGNLPTLAPQNNVYAGDFTMPLPTPLPMSP